MVLLNNGYDNEIRLTLKSILCELCTHDLKDIFFSQIVLRLFR